MTMTTREGAMANTTNSNCLWKVAGLALAGTLALALAGCESSGSGADGGDGAGGSGTGGTGGSGGTGGASAMACGFAEPEPNDTRDNPTPYTAGTDVLGCIGSMTDVDFYKVSSPADPAGGYFTGSITEVGTGTVEVKVYTASDNSAILENTYTVDEGGSLFFYWAAAPSQEYRIAVDRFGGFDNIFKYKLKASYTRVEDAHEPNDTKATATALTLGTPVMAKLFSGHKTKDVTEDEYFDWYKFDVATAGALNVKVEEVPTNLRVVVQLQNMMGSEVNNETGQEYNPTEGGSVTVGFMVTPGPYTLRVGVWSARPDTAEKTPTSMVPDHFTRAYKLTVSQ